MKNSQPTAERKFYGYIEGYYGRVLSWDQRLALVKHLAKLGLNSYLYAPKDDPWHRMKWREHYPAQWKRNLSGIVSAANKLGVDFIPSIGPGLSFDYLSEDDYKKLRSKFRAYLSMGVRTAALLMDDIPDKLPAKCEKKFASLGEAHGLLATRLGKDIPELKIIFCPTIYSDEITGGAKVSDCKYLHDLAATLPADMPVFWTGSRMVAESITPANTLDVRRIFGKRIILWDNLYANDYCTYRLFVGPYEKRTASMRDMSGGFMLNPTGLPETDKFLLSLFSCWIKTGRCSIGDWKRIAVETGVSPLFFPLAKFFHGPYHIAKPTELPLALRKLSLKIFNELVVGWQHPLKLEWYPWIHALTNDFNLTREPFSKNELWIRKRYPAPIYLKLFGKFD